jgi:hypothetical protein
MEMLLSNDKLFIETVKDLRNKLTDNSTYSLIRACGLCRHLLIDQTPLVHTVNRKYQIKINFVVSDFSDQFPMQAHTISLVNVQPILSMRRTVSLKEFLEIKILCHYQHKYSVCDVIQAASHMMGGIHSGKAKDQKDRAFLALDEASKSENSITLFALHGICNVVLKALEPLEALINANTPAGGN